MIETENNSHIGFVRQFASEVLSLPFSRRVWEQAAGFGLTALPVSKKHGGAGFGALDTMKTVEALGESCNDIGMVFSLCAHMFACVVPVFRYGSQEQHDFFLKPMVEGGMIAANAITEPDSGSDVYAMRTTFRREGDSYILNGEKCFITNAPIADVFLVYAKTNKGVSGAFGVSAFLVLADNPGLRVSKGGKKTGLNSSPWGSVYFNECKIPASARLGEEGVGIPMFHNSMVWERGCLFGAYVGSMKRALDQCVEYARGRKQFGQKIGANQSISNRLVDMKLRLDTSRLLLYQAGRRYDAGQPYEESIALSKLWISESAVKNGLDAIQIFGALGVSAETGMDQFLLDSLPARIFSGSSEIQRELIARHMGLR